MQTEPLHVGRTLVRARSARLAAGLSQVPLFHAAWLFGAGIAIARWFWSSPSVILIGLGMAAGLCLLAAFRAQRIAYLPMALLWCLLGAWCALMEPHPAPAPALDAMSDGLVRTVEGAITDIAPMRTDTEEDLDDYASTEWNSAPHKLVPRPSPHPSQRLDLRVSSLESITDDVDAQVPVSGAVRLTVRWPVVLAQSPASNLDSQQFHCGDRLRAQVRLLPPETYHDPTVFSRQDYLLDQGITSTATVNVEQIEVVGTAPTRSLACRLRAWQHASTARLLALPAAMGRMPSALRLTPDDAAMLSAMVAGDRTYLTQSLRVGFERTGSFHMLVVSGFHLAIVAACIFFVARRLRIPQLPATLLTIFASFAYALFTGFATPVQRSLWMVTLYLLARLVYRDRSPLNTIGFAALCLLVASPRSLFDAGLQMTLLAVIVIAGVAAPLLQGTVHPYINATVDLHLTAIDAGLPPPLAQFRVILRMFADALYSLMRAALIPLSKRGRQNSAYSQKRSRFNPSPANRPHRSPIAFAPWPYRERGALSPLPCGSCSASLNSSPSPAS